MQAIILAGGGGERLRPLTTTVPKPLLPVANQPVMERLIENLARAGFDEVLLTTFHLAPHIAAWLQNWTPPIPVRTVQEPRPLGTAGCVRHALPLLRDEFMVAPGDVVAECDFRAFVDWHRAQQADVSLLSIRVADTREFGVLETDAAGNIIRFQEKPAPHEAFSNLANAGFYLMHKRAFELVPPDAPFDFSRGLFPRLLETGARFKAWEARGYWADIGTPASYLAANRHLLHERGTVQGNTLQGVVQEAIRETVPGHAPHDLSGFPQAKLLAPSLVGAGCHLEAGAVIGPDTVLGAGCQIGAGARVVGSVLHAGVRVAAGATVEQCAIGAGACIEEGATVSAHCVVGAGCTVPAGASLAPGTRYEGPQLDQQGTASPGMAPLGTAPLAVTESGREELTRRGGLTGAESGSTEPVGITAQNPTGTKQAPVQAVTSVMQTVSTANRGAVPGSSPPLGVGSRPARRWVAAPP